MTSTADTQTFIAAEVSPVDTAIVAAEGGGWMQWGLVGLIVLCATVYLARRFFVRRGACGSCPGGSCCTTAFKPPVGGETKTGT